MGHHEARRRGRPRGAARAQDRGARRRDVESFAIAVARDSDAYEPEMLKDRPIAVTPNNGSHFTTLKIMDRLPRAGAHQDHPCGLDGQADRRRCASGKVAAVSLMEPWISVAQKQGLRILIESHRPRSEAAGDDLDGTQRCAAMFRAQAQRAWKRARQKDPNRRYRRTTSIAETGGLLEPHELQTWRLLHAAPQPYTRERFDDTYKWTVKWNMTIAGRRLSPEQSGRQPARGL